MSELAQLWNTRGVGGQPNHTYAGVISGGGGGNQVEVMSEIDHDGGGYPPQSPVEAGVTSGGGSEGSSEYLLVNRAVHAGEIVVRAAAVELLNVIPHQTSTQKML